MHQFKRILVGVDWAEAGSPEAGGLSAETDEAVQTASVLAAQLSAEITFCSIVDCVPEDADEATQAAIDERIRPGLDARLIGLADEAGQRGIAARACVCYGDAWQELIREVLRESYDLVIIGSRPSPEPVLGNTALKLLRNCPCAVWVAKPRKSEDFFVLVPSDLSELSADVLHLAVAIGQLTDSKTRLLHAVDFPPFTVVPEDGLSDEEERAKLRDEAEASLYEQLAGTDHRTLTYGILAQVEDGSPGTVIRKAIDEYSIDLLILGLEDRSGIPGQIGTTAETVLPHVSCGVLAMKPRDFQSPVTLPDTDE